MGKMLIGFVCTPVPRFVGLSDWIWRTSGRGLDGADGEWVLASGWEAEKVVRMAGPLSVWSARGDGGRSGPSVFGGDRHKEARVCGR